MAERMTDEEFAACYGFTEDAGPEPGLWQEARRARATEAELRRENERLRVDLDVRLKEVSLLREALRQQRITADELTEAAQRYAAERDAARAEFAEKQKECNEEALRAARLVVQSESLRVERDAERKRAEAAEHQLADREACVANLEARLEKALSDRNVWWAAHKNTVDELELTKAELAKTKHTVESLSDVVSHVTAERDFERERADGTMAALNTANEMVKEAQAEAKAVKEREAKGVATFDAIVAELRAKLAEAEERNDGYRSACAEAEQKTAELRAALERLESYTRRWVAQSPELEEAREALASTKTKPAAKERDRLASELETERMGHAAMAEARNAFLDWAKRLESSLAEIASLAHDYDQTGDAKDNRFAEIEQMAKLAIADPCAICADKVKTAITLKPEEVTGHWGAEMVVVKIPEEGGNG